MTLGLSHDSFRTEPENEPQSLQRPEQHTVYTCIRATESMTPRTGDRQGMQSKKKKKTFRSFYSGKGQRFKILISKIFAQKPNP